MDTSERHILLVSDKPQHLNRLMRSLSILDYQVDFAKDGSEALDLCREHPPDIILLSVWLPYMSGIEICRLIKSDPDLFRIPVVFLDDREDEETRLRCFEAGGVDILNQPFHSREVIARVDEHLSRYLLQRRLEIELEERQEMIWELEAFSRRVAHDLKNPLAAVIMDLQLVQKLLEKKEPVTQVEEVVGRASRTAWQCSNIVQDLWMLSVLKKADFSGNPVDMQVVVDSVIERFRYEVQARQAQISVATELPTVVGIQGWLEQIVANLLGNALKYGGKPPVVELGCHEVEEGEKLEFWVRDYGPGVPESLLKSVFKEKQSLSLFDQSGLGLGLSIVVRAISRMGGHVGVKNLEDGGAYFWFALPNPHHGSGSVEGGVKVANRS